MPELAHIAICGAGIAGVSLAFHLAVNHGVNDILLIDSGPPLSLTSDKSTECYRNWWPGPDDAMVRLMNRSIDLMESLARATGNIFNMNRRGYLYLTSDPQKAEVLLSSARKISRLGAGPLRIHNSLTNSSYHLAAPEGLDDESTGADFISSKILIQEIYPFLSDQTVAALHVRRAGWLSAQQLGRYLLDQALNFGVEFIQAKLTSVEILDNRINSITLDGSRRIRVHHLVNAAGPFLKSVGRMMGIDLPVTTELHLKVGFKDYLGVLPRTAPLLIWSDPQNLCWDVDEVQIIEKDNNLNWLLEKFPPGVHTRPEGPVESPIILMLWEYQSKLVEPIIPPPLDPYYPEIVLRGLTTMIPDLKYYIGKSSRPTMDGGYYTKTPENRPLISPLPVEGGWILGALSGYGIMAALAAGELLALHITNKPLPSYAPAFDLRRYEDPHYRMLLRSWGESGQL